MKLVGAPFDPGPYPFTEEQNQRFIRADEARRKKLEEVDLAHLRSMAAKAFSGERGAEQRAAAQEWSDFYGVPESMVGKCDRQRLEELRKQLRKVTPR